MRSRLLLVSLAVVVGMTAGCAGWYGLAPLPVVDTVDVERYMGRWYEIAKYPNWFQNGCAGGTTAEYTLLDSGRVRVVNRCREGSTEGPEDAIEGTARVVDATTNAKLKVGFFGPFEGDYWIIALDADYQWAVVGEPSRTLLWILSRTPALDSATYDAIIARLPDLGYDPARLVLTPQEDP